MSRLLTVAEVAQELRCGRSTVYRCMGRPDFPKPVRPWGGRPLWLASEIEDWALRQRRAPQKLSA